MFNLPPVVVKRALKYSAFCWAVSAVATIGLQLSQHPELEVSSSKLWIQIGGELVICALLAVFVFWLMIRASRVQAELEAAQRKLDARFRHLVDEASELLLTLDAAGQVVYASEAVKTLLGRTPTEVQGQLLLSLVTEADRALAERMLALVLGSARALHRFPLHLKAASGGARLVEILARNLLDHADVSAVLLHCRDITAEHRLVQEKHRSEDRMTQALAAGRLGSFEWNLRTDEIHPDQTFCTLIGLVSERNLIAKEDLLARLREEERQDLLAAVATARAKAGVVEAKFSLLNADGRSRTLELHAQFHADPQTAEVFRLFGFVQDITERTEMLQRIGRYAAFPMLDPNPVLEFDAEGKVTLANEATRTVCAECEMVPADLLPANFAQLVAQVAAGQGVRQAHELKRAERMFGITLSATAGVPSFRCYVMDLTEHFRMQQGLAAANRALRMLVDCNQIIERLDSEHELLEQVCRLIVGEGGYRMVWVGYGEQDAEKTVRPIAWAGVEDGYLNLAHITWADSERGQGPTGTAIRTRLPQTCRDIANAPQYAPWRDAALQRGYRSSGVFPLVHENTVFGTLNIYSAEVNHFDAEESTLLAELAGDLALGLGLIRSRRGQQVAEQSLAESEFRWRFAFEGYGDGLWDWNVPESTVFFSSSWKAMLGYADDEIGCGLDEWSKRVHPDDQARVMAEVQAHLAGTTPRYDSEHRVRCKDGSWLWIIDRGVVVSRDSAGQPLRAIGTHRDISERKRATALIEASERRYRRLFEAAQDGIFIVNAETGMIEDANPFLIKLLGFSKEEFLGKKLWEVGFFRNLVANQEKFAELQQKEYVRYEHLPLETKDGRRIDVEFVSNVYQENDRKVIQCNVRDISDRVRAVAERRVFRELVDKANDASEIIDPATGRFIDMSERGLADLGYTREEIVQMRVADIDPTVEPSNWSSIKEQVCGAKTFTYLGQHRRKDGTTFPVKVSARCIHLDREYIVTSVRDITERRQADAALQASEREFRSLAESMPQIVWITRPDGWNIYFNQQWVDYTGLTLEESYGHGWNKPFHPDDQQRAWEAWQYATQHITDYSIECRLRRADGTYRWWLIRGVPQRDASGQILKWFGTCTDIEDIKRAEAAFATFFEQPLAINMICATDGQIRRLNQAWDLVLGRDRQAAIGANILDFIHPDDRAGTVAELGKLAGGITTFHFENRYRHQDGTFRTLSWSSIVADGLAYGMAVDVTERKRAEAALQHSEQKIQALVQSAFDAIVTANGAGNIIGWNQAAAEMFGYAEAEVQGQPMTLLMPERFREAHRAGIQRVGSGDQRRLTAAVEVAGLHKDGREFPIELAISGWQIGANKFYSGIIRNIAGRKTTENQLKLQHAALAAAANAIIITDAKGTIEWVNDAFTQVSGYTYAEAVGQTPRLLKSGQHDFAFYQRLWATLLRGELWRSEMVNRRKDGSLWATEIAITPVKNSHGEITHYVSVNYDLTERRRTEAELRLLRAALEAAANVIVITDAKGTIEWVNDAFTRITGYRREEAIGNNPRVLKSGQHPPEFSQEMWRTISSGQVWHGEIHNQRKDGTPLEEDATITPVKDAAGVITHYIAIKQDITEKKALEKQFLRAQRMESVGMLAGGIAHDLNNVLAPISMGLELLQQVPLPDKFRPVIDSMLTSTQRGAGIVKQVLTFARGTDGERAIVQLRHLIKDIKRMAEETFPRNISLRSDVAADLWPLMADPSQLHQVLLNLSVNARDALPDGGQIRYSAQNLHLDEAAVLKHLGAKPGDYVLLKVTDTGTGMPPGVVERIFEPFFTTKPHGQGTGLGLPTVLGIIRSHGGFIEVQSVPGKGTTFEVYLPADQSSATVAGPVPAKLRRSGHGETILVVDDEPAVLAVTSSMLEANGYRVLVAEDGAAAVAVYAQHAQQIALVVTDIMMPLMDGVALIRSLQRLNSQVRIITVSGLSNQPGQPERHLELRSKGIRHHLDKPFTVEALLNALHEELHPAGAGN